VGNTAGSGPDQPGVESLVAVLVSGSWHSVCSSMPYIACSSPRTLQHFHRQQSKWEGGWNSQEKQRGVMEGGKLAQILTRWWGLKVFVMRGTAIEDPEVVLAKELGD
jgi:hypothetical protein